MTDQTDISQAAMPGRRVPLRTTRLGIGSGLGVAVAIVLLLAGLAALSLSPDLTAPKLAHPGPIQLRTLEDRPDTAPQTGPSETEVPPLR